MRVLSSPSDIENNEAFHPCTRNTFTSTFQHTRSVRADFIHGDVMLCSALYKIDGAHGHALQQRPRHLQDCG